MHGLTDPGPGPNEDAAICEHDEIPKLVCVFLLVKIVVMVSDSSGSLHSFGDSRPMPADETDKWT